MKTSLIKIGLRALCLFFLFIYITGAILVSQREHKPLNDIKPPAVPFTIAILGASGTAGDGILKAAIESPYIGKIHVLTRRITPRIQEGIDSGKVLMSKHMDYLDYSKAINQLAEVDAVYWAIGISSLGADEQTYAMIHVDFPTRFVSAWNAVRNKPNASFHFISSSDISENSDTMWVRQKIRAEGALFKLGEEMSLRVIAYRPDYIGPTREEAHLGQTMLYWFFKPVGAAVRAKQIGETMIETTIRSKHFENRAKVSTLTILQYSDAYKKRLELEQIR